MRTSCSLNINEVSGQIEYVEGITRWQEDMNFMFELQEQYLTSERSKRVGYCSCHKNIKSISSRHRVISSIYKIYGTGLATIFMLICVNRT